MIRSWLSEEMGKDYFRWREEKVFRSRTKGREVNVERNG